MPQPFPRFCLSPFFDKTQFLAWNCKSRCNYIWAGNSRIQNWENPPEPNFKTQIPVIDLAFSSRPWNFLWYEYCQEMVITKMLQLNYLSVTNSIIVFFCTASSHAHVQIELSHFCAHFMTAFSSPFHICEEHTQWRLDSTGQTRVSFMKECVKGRFFKRSVRKAFLKFFIIFSIPGTI